MFFRDVHKTFVPLGKEWFLLFSLQLRLNSRTDCVIRAWLGNQSWRRKTKFKPVKLCLKIDRVSHPVRAEGMVNTYIYIQGYDIRPNFQRTTASLHSRFSFVIGQNSKDFNMFFNLLVVLYSHIQLHVYKYTWEHNQLIKTISISKEYTSLFSKRWCLLSVRNEWRQGRTAILTQILHLTIAALLSHLGLVCPTGDH